MLEISKTTNAQWLCSIRTYFEYKPHKTSTKNVVSKQTKTKLLKHISSKFDADERNNLIFFNPTQFFLITSPQPTLFNFEFSICLSVSLIASLFYWFFLTKQKDKIHHSRIPKYKLIMQTFEKIYNFWFPDLLKNRFEK